MWQWKRVLQQTGGHILQKQWHNHHTWCSKNTVNSRINWKVQQIMQRRHAHFYSKHSWKGCLQLVQVPGWSLLHPKHIISLCHDNSISSSLWQETSQRSADTWCTNTTWWEFWLSRKPRWTLGRKQQWNYWRLRWNTHRGKAKDLWKPDQI